MRRTQNPCLSGDHTFKSCYLHCVCIVSLRGEQLRVVQNIRNDMLTRVRGFDHWFESKEGYDGRELDAYIQWVKSFEPTIPKETHEAEIVKRSTT